MSNPSVESVVQDIVRRETRSFLYYVGEVDVWDVWAPVATRDTVTALIASERVQLARLTQIMQEKRLRPPYPGSYPDFTGLNFIAADRLVTLLITSERKLLEELQVSVKQLPEGEIRETVEALVVMKQQNLEKLQSLQTEAAA